MIKPILREFMLTTQIIFLHFRYYFLFLFLRPKLEYASEPEYLVINSVRSYIPVQLAIEMKIALHAFRKGKKIVFLFDDNFLLTHDTHFERLCPSNIKLRFHNSLFTIYRLVGVHVYFYSCFKSYVSDDYLSSLDNQHLKDYWLASATRFTKSLPDEDFIRLNFDGNILDTFALNAKISYALGLYISKLYSKQCLLTSHAIYSTWGAFSLGYLDGGNHYICYGSNGYTKEVLDFAIDSPAANKINSVELKRIKRLKPHELSKSRELAREIFLSRCLSASQDQLRAGADSNSYLSPLVARQLEDQESKKLIAVFPNVMWDNATSFSDLNTIFENPHDWIVSLIEFAKANPSFTLVIRCHPAENSFMSSGSSLYWLLISGQLEVLPTNCVVIPPHDSSSSYALIKISHCVTVYNGTIGLETIWLSKPLILAANAAYAGRGFTNNFPSKNQYFKGLMHPESTLLLQDNNLDQFLSFSYYYFYRTGKDIGAMSRRRYLQPCWYLERDRVPLVAHELEDLHENYIQPSIDS